MKLHEFVARRLILLVPVMVGVAVFTFTIAQLIPADPAAALCGEKCGVVVDYTEDGEPITAYDKNFIRLGLDKSVSERFFIYVDGLLNGDWGESVAYHRPVIEVVQDAAPITLEMAFFALMIGYPIGIILGILSAVMQDRIFDHLSRFMAIAFVSLPIFWLAMMLQYYLATGEGVCDPLFGTEGGCFPLFGRHDSGFTYPQSTEEVSAFVSWYPYDGTGFHLIDSWFVTDEALEKLPDEYNTNWLLFYDTIEHLFLPSLTLGLASSGGLLRYMRSSLLEVMNEDYVRTARAKGLSESRTILVHACRNALVPIVTLLGFSIGGAIGGAVLTESIFSFNGMGRIAVKSIQYLDFATIMGVTLITSFIFLLSNLIVDVLYAVIDPRVRLE